MSTTTEQYRILIGGELADAASGETMEVIAPATGETIAEVPRCSKEDVNRAIEAAQAALPGIVTAIALSSAFTTGQITFSMWTIVVGHATFCVVVVYNNVLARLRRRSGGCRPRTASRRARP